MGIPLLHPWANRLSERRFHAAGREIDLDLAVDRLRLDPNGLPIHGLLAGHPGWVLNREHAGSDSASLSSQFDFRADPELIAAFPFAHELELKVSLSGPTLEIRTILRASGETPVPVSFGYHPYMTLPGVPREQWRVELPVSQHLVVDDRRIPTGEREPASGVEPGPLGART